MTLELDPDRRLALAYVPEKTRPAVEALWRLDVTLGSVLATGKEPMISQIRLAWWRESLEKLDRQEAPAEPTLNAVAELLIPVGVSGEMLARMEVGWAALLSPDPLDAGALDQYASDRGGWLFQLSARLLGEQAPSVSGAGELWSLVDLARHSGQPDAGSAMEAAKTRLSDVRWPARLRPLGMLAMLAERDLTRGHAQMERQGSPGRMLRMLRHRLSGR